MKNIKVENRIIKIKIPSVFYNLFNALNRNYNYQIALYENRDMIKKEKSVYGWSLAYFRSKKNFNKFGHFSFTGVCGNQSNRFLKIIGELK